MKKLMLFAVFSSLILTSCLESVKNQGEDKSELCVLKDEYDDISRCEDGQIIYFHQIGGGTNALPLRLAALYCNFDHSIVYNSYGVVCKLDKKRWEKFVERAKKNQQNQQE